MTRWRIDPYAFQEPIAVPIDGFDDLVIGDRDVMRSDAHKLPRSPYFLCVAPTDSSSSCHGLFLFFGLVSSFAANYRSYSRTILVPVSRSMESN